MPKVLLVDDDKLLRTLFAKRLEYAGYDIEIAKDGEEGLRIAKTFQPDIILLDYQMPILNGAKMLTLLRATPWGHSIPVVMMSAGHSLATLVNLNLVNRVVYKPITTQELLDAVEEFAPSSASV